jgi:hypothetical protein
MKLFLVSLSFLFLFVGREGGSPAGGQAGHPIWYILYSAQGGKRTFGDFLRVFLENFLKISNNVLGD